MFFFNNPVKPHSYKIHLKQHVFTIRTQIFENYAPNFRMKLFVVQVRKITGEKIN